MIHIFLFIIGACFGSFVNVMFSRKDWYKGRSRCDNCGYTLKWYDLIPIISYITLKGRCRNCKAKIDPAHLYSEILSGLTFVCISYCTTRLEVWKLVLCAVGLIFLCLASIEDIKEKMVYEKLLYAGIALTLAAKLTPLAIYGNWKLIVNEVIAVGLFKLIAFFICKLFPNKIGEGDFDLFIIILLMFGIIGMMRCITFGSLVGCLIYIPLILLKRYDKTEPLPFAPLLLIGTILNCFI